jgi:hypothetical protein
LRSNALFNIWSMFLNCTRECFGNWVFVANWSFSNSILFYKFNSNNHIKNLFNYPNQISILIQHFSFQMKSNNWTIQVIEFFNFKSLNFFKHWIDIKTNSAFFNYCQILVLNLPNFLFSYYNCLNLQSKSLEIGKWAQLCIVSASFTIQFG